MRPPLRSEKLSDLLVSIFTLIANFLIIFVVAVDAADYMYEF